MFRGAVQVGAIVEFEAAAVAIEHRNADDVCGQQVAGERYALKREAQEFRQRVGEGGLAYAGQILNQQMTAREQAGHGQAYLPLLAENHLARVGDDPVYGSVARREFRFGVQQQ